VQHLEQQPLEQNVTVSAVTADTSLNLTNVSTCSRPLSATSTVTVNAYQWQQHSSNSPICSGAILL
jgi:hypothetical protein